MIKIKSGFLFFFSVYALGSSAQNLLNLNEWVVELLEKSESVLPSIKNDQEKNKV